MNVFTLPIQTGKETCTATLDAYLLEHSPAFRPERCRPAILICPGGGYSHLSFREGEPIALRFNSLGFHAFVLHYDVAPHEYPTALVELALAVRLLREHAREWRISPDQIAVAGFSAGGHLAANLCVSYTEHWLNEALEVTPQQIQPNACVLSYPVITAGEYAHRGSMEHLLGEHLTPELLYAVSLEHQVHPLVPPTFLWHTFSDASVPVENSLLYAAALRKAGVMTELHIYPFGGHGLALATEETSAADGHQIVPECAEWPEHASRFLKQIFLCADPDRA